MDVHYMNTGFPYNPSETFMGFFEGLAHAPVHYPQVESFPEQVIPFSSVLNLSWMEGILCKNV